MTRPTRIVGICGSTNPESLNRGLLLAAGKLVPEGAELTLFELDQLPLYCVSKEKQFPDEAKRLKNAIGEADAVLFGVSEHNFSVSAALKNAIDWGSRPMGLNSWSGKPAALVGASPSTVGTLRAQYHLRQMLVGLDMSVVNAPEVFVAKARERLTKEGDLSDPLAQALIKTLLARLVGLARSRVTA